jgi:hypothetical protein
MYQDHKDLLSAFHAHGVKYRRSLPTVAAFFASDMTRTALTFFLILPAAILTRHGSGELRV